MKISKLYWDIYYGIRNIVRWFPVIWKDRQWDYHFLFGLLRFKLGLMEKFFREDALYVGAEEDAFVLRSCCNVLDRLIDDDYCTVAFEELDMIWGGAQLNVGVCYSLDISRPNVKTEQDKITERQEFLDCCKNEGNMRLYDINTLFTLMKKNVHLWWD